jgi:LEA14-like dessication related protein
MTRLLPLLLLVLATLTTGCASLLGADPVRVNVAGVESLPGGGLEMRMLVKLRVQNPNDTAIDYDGVYLQLDVQGSTFATGVSAERGSIPRYGEAVIAVPVTVSALNVVRQALKMLDGKPVDRIGYDMSGKLGGAALGGTHFRSQGELALPEAVSRGATR